MTPEDLFNNISERMESMHEGVGRGKMMSSPGIQYKGKNFAFFWDDTMVFRIGKGFNPGDIGVTEWAYLNPFKNKPPMKGWYRIPASEKDHWPDLADRAHAAMVEELG
ncbi:MAG: hypothetical protein ACE363_14035 [Alphaproteobacteria bacterium]